jgi:hypothetical protein
MTCRLRHEPPVARSAADQGLKPLFDLNNLGSLHGGRKLDDFLLRNSAH